MLAPKAAEKQPVGLLATELSPSGLLLRELKRFHCSQEPGVENKGNLPPGAFVCAPS